MKIYLELFNSRMKYLKKLLENKYEIVDDINKSSLSLTKTKQPYNNNYTFQDFNNHPIYKHLNNTLTAMSLILLLDYYQSVLILGYGNLAKQIARLLKGNITISNRNYKEVDNIKKYYKHIDINKIEGSYDIIINTIPSQVDISNVKYNHFYDLAYHYNIDHYTSLHSLPDMFFKREGAYLLQLYIEEVIECLKERKLV